MDNGRLVKDIYKSTSWSASTILRTRGSWVRILPATPPLQGLAAMQAFLVLGT